jgi:hypothetical protein
MNEKLETQAAQLDAIDQATLTPLVQSALGSKTVEVVNWECEQLHGGIGLGTAIYRFSGEGHDRGQKVPWSLILKTLCPAEDNANVSAWNYYKREADAYQSGLLDDLPGGLAAPRCFGVTEHPDGTCWIWLEDVAEEIGSHWPLEHFGVVARHAGQFNGAYLVERSLPSWPWLSSDWLRGYIALSAPATLVTGRCQRQAVPPVGRAQPLPRRPRPPAPDAVSPRPVLPQPVRPQDGGW